MKRLPRTLFRSLLKWNRQPELIDNPFVLSPSDYGIAELLPAGVTKLEGVEGVQAAIYHCFRHHPDTSANIDIAFNVMRKLNDRAVGLKKDLEMQKAHLDDRGATYRLGQVVMHSTTKVRGVVMGWEMGDACQTVRVLPDQHDYDELMLTAATALPLKDKTYIAVDEAQLELVHDPPLQHIHNVHMDAHFSHLDPVLRRYVPLDQLAFQYPMDVLDQPYNSLLLSSEARDAMAEIDDEVFTMQEALLAAMDAHFPGINSPDTVAVTDPLQKSRNDLARSILTEVFLKVKGMTETPPRSEFKAKLSRGGDLWMASGLAVTSSVETVRKLSDDSIAVREAFESMGRAVEVNMVIERLAQFRFQTKGIAFVDTLVAADDSMDKLSSQMSSDVKQMVQRTAQPAPVFTVGTTVRHKLFGYRGVISSYDIRPVTDTTSWEGVKNLPLGQEQPFYRVVPDQRDIINWLGPRAVRTSYYVAQENLEEVKDKASRIVNHAHLSTYFPYGYDIDEGRFRLLPLWKHHFPSGDHAFPADYPTTSLLQRWDSIHQAKADEKEREEIIVFQTIDHLLVCMRAIVKESLQRLANHEDALLLTVLKEAPTKDWALSVENLLWFANISSSSSDASACMRTGLAAFYRGNVDEAREAIERAVAYDPEMIEAHNKRADLLMHAGEYEAAIAASNDALAIDDEHFGGYYGLALAAAKKGNNVEAVKYLRNVLDIYPWADKVPTKLQMLLNKVDEEDDVGDDEEGCNG